MSIEVYGARHISMKMFGPKDKKEINRLKSLDFEFVCKDNSYFHTKAFKREPELEFRRNNPEYRFIIHPKTDEKLEDIMIDYGLISGEFPFLRILKSGEMFDINIMVAFDCVHWKQEEKVKNMEISWLTNN